MGTRMVKKIGIVQKKELDCFTISCTTDPEFSALSPRARVYCRGLGSKISALLHPLVFESCTFRRRWTIEQSVLCAT
ncbi:hypothetical protein HER10_EVM0000010 [Colletotrichum scovillei]|uniref:uncharacterized protein n=1 Tax=Colletotrichum scovillei TaxID=1209932 RepID=UPI0015C2F1D1|nr:uncharacterized protein HER10_EVM0000010 [Colletotrichum scovillei]KAF4778988.1 hypothetical protein HER10_EVM0000010 [Colletotrichum scovillei]